MGDENWYFLNRLLVDTATLVDEVACRSGLARVDVADNDPTQERSIKTCPKRQGKEKGVETKRRGARKLTH